MIEILVSTMFLSQEIKDPTMDWKKAGAGILCGTEEKKNGWKHFTASADWEAFRKAHPGPEKGSKMAEDYRPLPDFDFAKHELLLVWAGTMARELEIVSMRPGVVEVFERMPSSNEDHMARMWGAGTYLMLALPRSGKAVTVKWAPDPPAWKLVSYGLLSAIEDGKSDWIHLRDAAAYDAFRKKHVRITSRSKREQTSEPLPEFDLSKFELVAVWGGTMYRTVEVLTVQDGVVVAQESYPSFNENEAARMVNAGSYVLVSVPRTRSSYKIRWAK